MSDSNTEQPLGIEGLLRDIAAQEEVPVQCEHRYGTWFDRTICPDPCGAMHDRCQRCGGALGDCPVEGTS